MNVAIASPSSSAYSETFIKMQMEMLPCSLRIHGGPVASETIPGGAIRPLKSVRGILDTAYWCGIKGTRWEGPQSAELGRRLRKAKIKVVLANYGPTGVALMRVCRIHRIPMVVHFHGYDAHKDSIREAYKPSYIQLGMECARIIVVSERMRSALNALGMPQEKMRLVRCGANATLFSPRESLPAEPTFLGVGRFVDKKAPYLTLLAFKDVHDRYPAAKLILAGDGSLLEATKNLAGSMGLEGAVTFPGILAPAEVAEQMRRSTAFVQHSLVPLSGPDAGDSEGTPVAILEAMLTGIPVIATRHAGIGEVIDDGKTGILINERDVAGMSRAMATIIESKELNRRMGADAREVALKRFTSDAYITDLKAVLNSVLT